MNDQQRRQHTIRWDVHYPVHTLDALIAGIGDFRVNPLREELLLEVLLQHDFLASRHLLAMGLFASPTRLSRRLSRLCREGFVARTIVSARPSPAAVYQDDLTYPQIPIPLEQSWEYAWTLTQFGFDTLLQWDNEDARRVATRWHPNYETRGFRNNVIHDVAVADLCQHLITHLTTGHSDRTGYWVNAKSAVQRLETSLACSLVPRQYLSPDAVVMISGPDAVDMILVEYEESARPDSVRDRCTGYSVYFHQRGWKPKFPEVQSPHLLWSFTDHSDRQRYWAQPFVEAQKIVKDWPMLNHHAFLLNEQEWRRGRWLAYPADSLHVPLSVEAACVTLPLRPFGVSSTS